jgi:hypothetical protein
VHDLSRTGGAGLPVGHASVRGGYIVGSEYLLHGPAAQDLQSSTGAGRQLIPFQMFRQPNGASAKARRLYYQAG